MLDFNESFTRMSGIGREEGIARAADDLVIWDDAGTMAAVAEVLRSDDAGESWKNVTPKKAIEVARD